MSQERKPSVDWSKYGWCYACYADDGKPCIDQRYASRMGTFYCDRPHRGRTKR